MIVLTDAAAEKVRELIDAEGEPDLALRVAVRPGGCSGFSYEMFFDSEVEVDDMASAYGTIRVVSDPMSAQLLEGNHWSRAEDGWRGAAGGPPILLSTPTEESPSVHRVAGTLEPGAVLLLDGVRFDASGVHVECFEGGANRTIDLADGISTDPSGRVTIPTTVILRDGGRLVVTQAGRRLIECAGVEAPRALTVAGEGGEARLTTLDRLAPRRAGE